MLEIKCLICWNTVRITAPRIRLNQLSSPNHGMLNRIGARTQVRCLLTFTSTPGLGGKKTKKNRAKNSQRLQLQLSRSAAFWMRHRGDGINIRPVHLSPAFSLLCCVTGEIARGSLEWMGRLCSLVIKRQGVTISAKWPFMFPLVWPPRAGQNDNTEERQAGAFPGVFVKAYQMIGAERKSRVKTQDTHV